MCKSVLALVEEFHHKVLIRTCDSLDEVRVHLADCSVVGDGYFRSFAVVIFESLVLNEVDVAVNFVPAHVGDKYGADSRAVFGSKSVKSRVKALVLSVNARDSEELCYSSLCSRFERFFRADVKRVSRRSNYKCATCGANSFGYAALKVEKTGSVDDIHFSAVPLERCHSGRNRCLAAFFLGVEVEYCVAVGNFTKTVCCACGKKHSLTKSCFTPAAMADDSDVANVFCCIRFHNIPPISKSLITIEVIISN